MNSSLLVLAGLGVFHGLNPGMGWLFAVALGMQEGRQTAVWRALIPLTAGHCFAVGAAVLAASIGGIAFTPEHLRWPLGLLLLALGIRQCYRHRHVRWASMRVGMGGLTWWSFLMASAHGAGIMVLPLFLSMTAASGAAPACHGYAAMEAGLGAPRACGGIPRGHGCRCVDRAPLFRSRTAAEGVDQSGSRVGRRFDDYGYFDADPVRSRRDFDG